jgi:hypothetical protein
MRSRTWAWVLRRSKPAGFIAQGVMSPDFTPHLYNAEMFPSRRSAEMFKRNYLLCADFEPVSVRLA